MKVTQIILGFLCTNRYMVHRWGDDVKISVCLCFCFYLKSADVIYEKPLPHFFLLWKTFLGQKWMILSDNLRNEKGQNEEDKLKN